MAKSATDSAEPEGATDLGPRSNDDAPAPEPSDAAAARDEGPPAPYFAIERIFLRDLSFESPRAPEVFDLRRPPEFKLEVQTRARATGKAGASAADRFEVVLTLTLAATTDDDGDLMIIEVQQAGLFHIRGMDAPTRERVLAVVCPATLFPYAREAIDSVAVKGSLPPPALGPVNFEALYARSLEEEQG